MIPVTAMTSSELRSAEWEGIARPDLRRRWGVPALHLYSDVGSTNDVARRLAAEGAEPGTAVVADRQLAGRGRAGRAWSSPSGIGLWLSMTAPPPADATDAGMLPLRVGIAIARAVDRFTAPLRTRIKWPNDLLLGGAKYGGILCEGSWEGNRPGAVIVGVGLNIAHDAGAIPSELRGTATSIALARGTPVRRLEIADAVVPALLDVLERPLPAEELADELLRRDVLRGSDVVVSDPATGAEMHSGLAMGIAPDGSLLLRDRGGTLQSIRSGTVRGVDGAYIPSGGSVS